MVVIPMRENWTAIHTTIKAQLQLTPIALNMITIFILNERDYAIGAYHHSLLSILAKGFNKLQFNIPAHAVMLRFFTFHAVNLILAANA